VTTTTAAETGDWLQSFIDETAAAQQPVVWEDVKPSDSPPIAEGKRIIIVPITLEGQGTILQVEGAQAAAEALGWESDVCDAQGTGAGANTCMLNAITAGYDGMYLAVVDQRQVTEALRQAYDAGIPVVTSLGGNNVDDNGDVQPGTDPEDVLWDINGNGIDEGHKLASYVIAESQGQANYVLFEASEFVNAVLRITGMENALADCETCVANEKIQYTLAEINDLPLRVISVLRASPDIDWIGIDVGPFVHFLVEGIEQLGVQDQVRIVSYDCVEDQIDRIKAGRIEVACQGVASEALGWAAMDELNRAFNDAPVGRNPLLSQTITQDNVNEVTDPNGYTGGFDYISAYKELWGIGS
jgi:ribose transport system substrate-binding protein